MTVTYTQIPVLTNWRSTDSVWMLRQILAEHEYGTFTNSAPLWEELLSDDRISAVIDTRVGGVLSAELTFVAANGKRKATNLARMMGGSDATRDDGMWTRIVDPENAAELLRWRIGIGVAFGTVEWKVIDGAAIPRLVPWHPKYLRFDWGKRRFFAITMEGDIELPDTDDNPRSDGKWFMWGTYRSWMQGAVRSLGMKFIDRNWTERDWARYCEKYGLNIIEGKVPSQGNAEEKAAFEAQLRNLGSEPTVVCPQGSDGSPSYGLEIHEASSQGWQAFKSRKEALDTDIAVKLLGQNLTTEVQSGSLASTKVHDNIRGDVKRRDARIFDRIREQVLCWWAHNNFGDAGLAPYPTPILEAATDPTQEATALNVLGEACQKLQLASSRADIDAILEAHGVPLFDVEEQDEDESAIPVSDKAGGIDLTPSAEASIVTVNEARAQKGMPPWPNSDGELTISEFQAKHAEAISKAANAEAGTVGDGAPDPALALPPKPSPGPGPRPFAQMGLVALRAPLPAAVSRKKFYAPSRLAKARRMAAAALKPEVQAVLEGIRNAKSFDEVKALVLKQARARGANIGQLASIVERMNMLAHLEGREDVLSVVLR